LTIGAREGDFDGMLKDRTFNIVFVSNNKGNGELESKAIDKTVKYTGASITIKK
jgi:alpha-D-xyloside xylohydrolase